MNEEDNQNSPGVRKRRRKRPEIDHSVPSPCVAVCAYNGDGLCEGCLRSPDEIRDWMIMSREQKLALLDTLKLRREETISRPTDDECE